MKAMLFGATGLVGSELLSDLIEDSSMQSVILVSRKAVQNLHDKCQNLVRDFDTWPSASLPKVDVVFIALGTTMKVAGSKEAFYKVDYTYIVEWARAAFKSGCKKAVVVSALGADKDSMVYYSRVKGEMEIALQKIGFESLTLIRPSLIQGPRKEKRLGEQIFGLLAPLCIGPLSKYKPVLASRIAEKMLSVAKSGSKGVQVIESSQIG